MQQTFSLALIAALSQAVTLEQSTAITSNTVDLTAPAGSGDRTGVDQNLDYFEMEQILLDGTTGDAQTQPLCAIAGEQGSASHEMPTDHCCRVYELPEFYGRYMDFCAQSTNGIVPDGLGALKSVRYELLKHGWTNEVSSWKCGHQVAFKACTDALHNGTGICDKDHSESGSPGMTNPEVYFDDDWEILEIISVPPPHASATIYGTEGCRGRSALLLGGDLMAGSWATYNSSSLKMLEDGNVLSVASKAYTDVEFFKQGEFLSHGYDVRNFAIAQCTTLTHVPFPKDLTASPRNNGIYSAWIHVNFHPGAGVAPAGLLTAP